MTITYAPGQSPDDVAKALDAMRTRLANLQPVLAVQAEGIRKLIDDSFRAGRSPDGTPWKPNAPATIDRKGSAKPGVDTGLMRNSITASASARDITIGTNVPYAGPNQFGAEKTGTLKRKSYKPLREAGTAWKTTQPARPFLPFRVDGTLITIGPASRVWTSLTRAVGVYITTGKVT